MNRLLSICAGAAISLNAFPAVSEPPTGTFDIPYFSKYVWRGLNLVDAGVLQPSLTFESKGYTFQVWTNIELTNDTFYPGFGSGKGKLTELDISFQYNWNCGQIELSAGFIHYRFPNTGFEPTTEVFISAGFDGFLTPTIIVYQDVDQTNGAYANFSLSHSFATGLKIGQEESELEISTGIGFCSNKNSLFYYGVNRHAAADWMLNVALPISLKGWTLTPAASYSHLIDSEIGAFATKRSNLWFSIGASFGF